MSNVSYYIHQLANNKKFNDAKIGDKVKPSRAQSVISLNAERAKRDLPPVKNLDQITVRNEVAKIFGSGKYISNEAKIKALVERFGLSTEKAKQVAEIVNGQRLSLDQVREFARKKLGITDITSFLKREDVKEAMRTGKLDPVKKRFERQAKINILQTIISREREEGSAVSRYGTYNQHDEAVFYKKSQATVSSAQSAARGPSVSINSHQSSPAVNPAVQPSGRAAINNPSAPGSLLNRSNLSNIGR